MSSRCHCPCNQGGKWLSVGKDETSRSYNSRSKITAQNASSVNVVYEVDVPSGSPWSGVTTDGDIVYFTNRSGVLSARRQSDGAVVFEVDLADVGLENSRDAPAIAGDVIVFTERVSRMRGQSWLPRGSDDQSQNVVYSVGIDPTLPAAGTPIEPLGRPPMVAGFNRFTGELLWKTPIAEKAVYVDDVGNYRNGSSGATVFYADAYNCGKKIPVVAVGTSSNQSFTPFNVTRFQAPFPVPAAYFYYANPDDVPFPAQGRKVDNLSVPPNQFCTDMGELYFIDARNGRVISSVKSGPEQYREGDQLDADSLRPGRDRMMIWHYVKNEDLESGGQLNVADGDFAGGPVEGYLDGRQRITYTLETRAAVEAGLPANVTPAPLDGVVVMGRPPVATDPVAPVITLEAGKPLNEYMPENALALEGVVVAVETEFSQNSTKFTVNDQEYDYLDDAVAFRQLDTQFGLRPVRIVKRLRVGDTLDNQDAYEASYHGGSIWGNAPIAVRSDKCGRPLEAYATCGQAHHTPADDLDATYGIFEADIAARRAEGKLREYVPQSRRLFEGISAYLDAPSEATLAVARDAVEEANANDLAGLELLETLSPRGRRFAFDGVVAISLRPESFGQYLWNYRTRVYDTWSTSNLASLNRSAAFAGLVDVAFAVTDIGEFNGISYSPDADLGQNAQLFPRDNLLALGTKGGTYVTLELTGKPGTDTSGFAVRNFIRAGPSSVGGGSNLGAANNERLAFNVQLNEPSFFFLGPGGLPYQTGDRGFPNPMPQNLDDFPLAWVPYLSAKDDELPTPIFAFTSFLSYYEPRTGDVRVEKPLTTSFGSSEALSYYPSCNRNVIALLVDASGEDSSNCALQIYDSTSGDLLREIPFPGQSAGIGHPTLVTDNVLFTTSSKLVRAQIGAPAPPPPPSAAASAAVVGEKSTKEHVVNDDNVSNHYRKCMPQTYD